MTLELTQMHRDILQFFEKPRYIHLTDIAEGTGWSRKPVTRRINELADAGLLKRIYPPHARGKPVWYERTTKA